MGKMVDSDGYNIVKCTYIESQMARMTNAMFFKGGLTRKHCFQCLPTLGFYPKILGFFWGHWDFHGIFILRIRLWDFSWDFSEFRK